MGVIITPKAEIDRYFESTDMSQSLLKKLLGGIEKFKAAQEEPEQKLYYEEKGNLIIGSAVDTILTGEHGQFEQEYYLSELEQKPSDVEMSITQHVFDAVTSQYEEEFWREKPLSHYQGLVVEAIEAHNWQPNWKAETKLNKISEKCADYFEDLKRAFGKQILSNEQKITIDAIVMSFKTHERTRHLFDRETQERNGFMDVYYQLPVYFRYKDVDCKALLDQVLMVANGDDNLITDILPYDVKTMEGETYRFPRNMWTWRYDIQGAWYTLALKKWVEQNPDKCAEDVKIHPYQFVVESTSIQGKPLVFQMTPGYLQEGATGRPQLDYTNSGFQTIIRKEIAGYEQLLDLYLWHEENGWEEEKEIKVFNDEPVEVDYNGIVKK